MLVPSKHTGPSGATSDPEQIHHARMRALLLLGFLALLAVAGLSLRAERGREAIAARAEAEATERAAARATLHELERHLEAEVIQWSAILLGGSDRAAFSQHRDAFFREEKATRDTAISLGDAHRELREDANALLRAHDEMGLRYRTALRVFVDAGGTNAAEARRLSEGVEAQTRALLDQLIERANGATTPPAAPAFLRTLPWLLTALAFLLLCSGLVLERRLRAAQTQRSAHDGAVLGRHRDLTRSLAARAGALVCESDHLGARSDAIASKAADQAGQLAETARTLGTLSATVKRNAQCAEQANQLASGARDVAEKGGRIVGDAVAAMAQINASSKQIADIITTIDEIAFQTNLLALNAAVEAACAGEQGRGFAVVAEEVRSLAQRSAGAAKEIKTLIQDSVKKVESGAELVNASGQTLHEIVSSVKQVTSIVQEIAAASREQSAEIDQINASVTQMDRVTQSNARETEELSAIGAELREAARQMELLAGRAVPPRADSEPQAHTPTDRRHADARLAHAA